MKNWFTSPIGAVTVTVLTLLVFLGRTFIDFHYVYSEFDFGVGMVTLVNLIYLALFGGWIWSLLAAVRGSRRGWAAAFGFSLFFLLVIAAGTLVSYCPSPCRTAWPVGEIFIWLSLIFGLLASAATAIQLWDGHTRRMRNPAGAES